MKKCKFNKGSFWLDKNCFRDNCENCPIKQEQELGNPLTSNIKRTSPLKLKELFFRDKVSIINILITIFIIVMMIIGVRK